ncbi:hypothetical protein HDU77_008742 [Chytriomyces hyalinus]|nr:hypothetical protein HDU77_008742 [Chytriomyces hyalinus]
MPSSTDCGNDIDWLFTNLASATPATDDLFTPAFSLSNLETPPTSLLHHFDAYPSSFNFGSNMHAASLTQLAEPKSAQTPKYDDGFLAELFQFLEGGSAASPNPSPVLATSASETLDFFSADFTLFDTSSTQQQQQQQQAPQVIQNKSLSSASSSKCGNSTSQQKSRSFKCHVVGCTKVYAHNRNLTAHIRLDHSGMQDKLNSSNATHPFHCKVCNAGFRYSQTRNRHERNFHPMLK